MYWETGRGEIFFPAGKNGLENLDNEAASPFISENGVMLIWNETSTAGIFVVEQY